MIIPPRCCHKIGTVAHLSGHNHPLGVGTANTCIQTAGDKGIWRGTAALFSCSPFRQIAVFVLQSQTSFSVQIVHICIPTTAMSATAWNWNHFFGTDTTEIDQSNFPSSYQEDYWKAGGVYDEDESAAFWTYDDETSSDETDDEYTLEEGYAFDEDSDTEPDESDYIGLEPKEYMPTSSRPRPKSHKVVLHRPREEKNAWNTANQSFFSSLLGTIQQKPAKKKFRSQFVPASLPQPPSFGDEGCEIDLPRPPSLVYEYRVVAKSNRERKISM